MEPEKFEIIIKPFFPQLLTFNVVVKDKPSLK